MWKLLFPQSKREWETKEKKNRYIYIKNKNQNKPLLPWLQQW